MAYADLSAFLPRAEGDKLNVEQARAEAAKRADYLSSMDQFYESLEETQRQFDIQQELAERQFEWESGFSERKLTTETRLGEERLALEKLLGTEGIRLKERELSEESRYRKELLELEGDKLEMAKSEQDFLQWMYGEQTEMAWGKYDLESQVVEQELNPFPGLLPGRSGRFRSDWDRTGGVYGASKSRKDMGYTPYRGYANPSSSYEMWR